MRQLINLPSLIFIAVLFTLVGCSSSTNLTAYPTPVTATTLSTATLIPAATHTPAISTITPAPTEAISDCPDMPTTWIATPPAEWSPAITITMPIEAAEALSPEEIVIALFCQYLEGYTHPQTDIYRDIYRRMDDYRVYNVSSEEWLQHWLEEGHVDFVAEVHYSVLTTPNMISDWWGGSGDVSKDGWIRNKQQVVGFLKHNEVYEMKLFGN